MTGKESCIFQGKAYTHGTEICTLKRCRVCIDGHWRDKKLYGSYVTAP